MHEPGIGSTTDFVCRRVVGEVERHQRLEAHPPAARPVGCARDRRRPARPWSPAASGWGMTMARANWRAVCGSTAASASPSRRCRCQSSGWGEGQFHEWPRQVGIAILSDSCLVQYWRCLPCPPLSRRCRRIRDAPTDRQHTGLILQRAPVGAACRQSMPSCFRQGASRSHRRRDGKGLFTYKTVVAQGLGMQHEAPGLAVLTWRCRRRLDLMRFAAGRRAQPAGNNPGQRLLGGVWTDILSTPQLLTNRAAGPNVFGRDDDNRKRASAAAPLSGTNRDHYTSWMPSMTGIRQSVRSNRYRRAASRDSASAPFSAVSADQPRNSTWQRSTAEHRVVLDDQDRRRILATCMATDQLGQPPVLRRAPPIALHRAAPPSVSSSKTIVTCPCPSSMRESPCKQRKTGVRPDFAVAPRRFRPAADRGTQARRHNVLPLAI